jgi:hypothetical protein
MAFDLAPAAISRKLATKESVTPGAARNIYDH